LIKVNYYYKNRQLFSKTEEKIMKVKINKTLRRITKVCLLIIVCMMVINFSFRPLKIDHRQKEKIDQWHHVLSNIEMATQFDSIRRCNSKKIVAIIDLYNPVMKEDLKYQIADEIQKMSLKYSNLDIELICATITHESARTWNPEVISPVGALGLMQIMPTTGISLTIEEGLPWHSAEETLFNPIYNIRLGCRYLSTLIKAYSIDGGLAAYNGGMKRAEQWIRNGRADGILHEETAFYVPSILKIYEEYQHLNI